MTDKQNDIDELSGVETTGHEWDGLKELNNPLPRWWLWVMYATIVWAIVYYVLYPAWPTPDGNTKGTLGYTQYGELAKSQKEIRELQAQYLADFQEASYEDLLADTSSVMYNFAYRGGASAFKDNCATCHGTGATGFKGYPSLVDDDWLWGGTLPEIEQTIRHGIRSKDEETRYSEMPAFGVDQLLTPSEINQVARHVLSLSNDSYASTEAAAQLFEDNCSSCHGPEGRGDPLFGAPNLADQIWLYGDAEADVAAVITKAPKGVMPHWQGRLDDDTIRQLAFYVHQLGGGARSKPEGNATGTSR